MKKTIKMLIGFYLIFFIIQSPVYASQGAAEELQNANKAYEKLCDDANKVKSRANWIKLIDQYQKISLEYAQSDLAPMARYRAAKLYEQLYNYSTKNDDLKKAIKTFLSVLSDFPQSSLADDSIYKSAWIYDSKLGKKEKALELYTQIVNDFPHGDMAQAAKEGISILDLEKISDKASSNLSLIKGIRQWSDNGSTRVVIDLQKDASFNTLILPSDEKNGKPNRVVLDINNARTHPGLPYKKEVNDGRVSNIRISQYTNDKVRVVLDLPQKSHYNAFSLENPSRLVVDVSKGKKDIHDKKISLSYNNGIKKVQSGSRTRMADNVPSIVAQLSLKVSRIVIDPGHGGKDPGAISPSGIKEKDITLAIAKLLAKRLKQEEFEVYLTRDRDIFVPLEERTAFANNKKADLFLSIHINSNTDHSVKGIETYFLNLTTDASAIEVAARENATTSKSLSDLQLILNDLMLNSKINESSKFASCLHKSVISSLVSTNYHGRDLGVRQAPFYVLLGAQMPSVLLELGFITNTDECVLLKKRPYQNIMIDGIAKGINNYIMNTTHAYLVRSQ